MFKKIILCFLTGLFVLTFSTTKASDGKLRYLAEIFPEVESTKDIIYKTVEDRSGKIVDLKLDIYAPKNDTLDKRPLVVWIHGGGFYMGNKSVMASRCIEFAKMGYVAATINYRLSREYTSNIMDAISDATEDARSAIDWLRKNATKYGIDIENIFVGGSSAGGITSLHLGYEDTGWDKSGIKGIIDLWGALFNLDAVDPKDPPVIIIHGTEDKTVPFQLSLELVKKLKENNIYFEFYPVKGVGHGVPPTPGHSFNYLEALFIYYQLDADI
jgi:acetyl esterase/lipase